MQTAPLFSECLRRRVYLDVSASTLKHIDRAGGLDMYLLTTSAATRSSVVAEQLRGLVRAVRYHHSSHNCRFVPAAAMLPRGVFARTCMLAFEFGPVYLLALYICSSLHARPALNQTEQ